MATEKAKSGSQNFRRKSRFVKKKQSQFRQIEDKKKSGLSEEMTRKLAPKREIKSFS